MLGKILAGLVLLIAIAIAVVIWQRHWILIEMNGSGQPPPFVAAVDEGPQATWFDDYFLLVPLQTASSAEWQTYAIGEPLYAQQNFSYLIIGTREAVLFDAGPGYRDLRVVVAALTDLPVTFIPSHFHYDHVGNEITFDQVAVIDLPHLRQRAPDNRLTLTWQEHLGTPEGVAAPTLQVDRWLTPNEFIDLGGRELQVLYTPGHTTDSVSLYDIASQMLFSGDFIYPGPLYGFLPTSSLGDYLQAVDVVQALTNEQTRLLGAHRERGPGLPELAHQDLQDLRTALLAIRAGTTAAKGNYPKRYAINERMIMLAEPAWLQNWQPTYPEFSLPETD